MPGLIQSGRGWSRSSSGARELSYAAIARRVDAATSAFTQAGLAPGQRIGIHCRDRLLQVIVVLAVARIVEATFVFSPDGAFAPGSIDLLLSDHTERRDKVKTILIDADALAASTAEPRGPIASAPPGNSTWLFAGRDPVELGGNALRARIARRSLAKGHGQRLALALRRLTPHRARTSRPSWNVSRPAVLRCSPTEHSRMTLNPSRSTRPITC